MKRLRVFLASIAMLVFLTASVADAAVLFNYPKFRGQTSTGAALSGGLLYTYAPGTSTPKATYADKAKAAANTNPVVLDSNGEATVFMDGYYKVVLKNSAGVTQWTMDNVQGIGSSVVDYVTIGDYSGDLATAVSAIGATETTLIINEATTASTNVTVPSTLSLKFEKGGIVTIASGKTVTINGAVSAGLYQIFSGSGTATFSKVNAVYPEWWGAVATTDGSTDCTSAITAAVTAYGHVVFSYYGSGYYYKVSTAVPLLTNTFLEGVGEDKPQIYNDTAGAYAVFTITGTSGTKLDNITIKRLNIRNGTSTTGAGTSGKDGINARYVTDFTIEDCIFPDTQGAYVIQHRYSKRVKILRNRFVQWTYTAIASLMESEDTLIQGNWFGTALTTAWPQQYAINGGSDTLSEGTFSLLEWRCLDNTFEYDNSLSTSNWFAIVTHGGSYIWTERNRILNYVNGIQHVLATGYWDNPINKNIWVRDNVIDRGAAIIPPTGHTDHVTHGIQVQGVYWNTDGNYTIEGNYVKGMGAASPSSAAIIAGYGYNVKINRNKIENYYGNAIYLQKAILGGEVLGNDIKNYIGGATGYGIYANTGGLYGIFIDYNKIWATSAAYQTTNGVHTSSTYYHNVIVGEHNEFQTTTNTVVGTNWNFTAKPTNKYWKHGDYFYGTFGSPNPLGVTQSVYGNGFYGWLKTAQTCTGTSGESTVTLTNTSLYYEFPIGGWITITQDDASTLTTQVMNVTTAGVLTLANSLTDDVTGGAIAMVTPVFMPLHIQPTPTAKTTSATLTIAELLTKIITGTHSAGATQTYTLPTGTLMDAGTNLAINESFDWQLINLSANAADTITVAGDTGHTIVGNAIVQSSHASTGLLYGYSATFRSRKTAANVFVTYRIN